MLRPIIHVKAAHQFLRLNCSELERLVFPVQVVPPDKATKHDNHESS